MVEKVYALFVNNKTNIIRFSNNINSIRSVKTVKHY